MTDWAAKYKAAAGKQKTKDAANEVDYTKMRKGTVIRRSNTGKAVTKIEVCPKCGRKGEMTRYPKGTFDSCTHKGINRGWIFQVTDSCEIIKEGKERGS